MSSHPHIVLPWFAGRTGLPLLPLADPMLARRNRFSLDWTGAWRLDTPPAWLDQGRPVRVETGFEVPVPLRLVRLSVQGPGPSRNEVRRQIKRGIPLRRPTSTGFAFAVMPQAYQRGRRRRALELPAEWILEQIDHGVVDRDREQRSATAADRRSAGVGHHLPPPADRPV